jgi:tRNA threonylcarbamoyl adenosine modification protein YeaZ
MGHEVYREGRAAEAPCRRRSAAGIVARLRVLAVDTSSERSGVALVESGVVRAEVRLLTQVPSVSVLPAVEFVLASLQITAADIEGYAVGVGPGSFTGVRVALSTVQGLALASGRPCVGVSSLDAVASLVAGQADTIVAVMDAYRDEVFVARYDRDARPLGPPSREKPEIALADLPPGAVLAGDAALRHAAVIAAMAPNARMEQGAPYLAAAVGRVGESRLVAGLGVTAADLRPLYLRDADIRPPAR